MSNPLDDIYSPENIARSRARATGIRDMVAGGNFDDAQALEWLEAADAIDAGADDRELNRRTLH